MVGARWDSAAKKWYAPEGKDVAVFNAWLPTNLKASVSGHSVSSAVVLCSLFEQPGSGAAKQRHLAIAIVGRRIAGSCPGIQSWRVDPGRSCSGQDKWWPCLSRGASQMPMEASWQRPTQPSGRPPPTKFCRSLKKPLVPASRRASSCWCARGQFRSRSMASASTSSRHRPRLHAGLPRGPKREIGRGCSRQGFRCQQEVAGPVGLHRGSGDRSSGSGRPGGFPGGGQAPRGVRYLPVCLIVDLFSGRRSCRRNSA